MGGKSLRRAWSAEEIERELLKEERKERKEEKPNLKEVFG